jgi:hypothetical protein
MKMIHIIREHVFKIKQPVQSSIFFFFLKSSSCAQGKSQKKSREWGKPKTLIPLRPQDGGQALNFFSYVGIINTHALK